MGCQTSRQENHDIVSLETEEQFRLSYKQLITQDRGHIFQLYHFSTIFNRSNYSIVRKVVSRASQQTRVCKIVPLLNQKYFSVISEVQFLKKLDHPNIIQILEYFLQPSFLYIVLEQIPGDRLLRQLNKVKDGVLFNQVVDIIVQLLRAVDFCHRKQIAHRAITTQNIVLFFNADEPYLKLIDFSQACTIGCTNPPQISAEKRNVILGPNQQNETEKIDIYDCGIVIYALIAGKRIKSNKKQVNYKQIIENATNTIKQAKLGQKISQQLINLLASMLDSNPKNRPTASQCLKHPFFLNFDKKICSKKVLDNMIKFQPDNNLKYLLSMYASLNMTSAMQKAEHLSQFYSLDKNKDGQIQMEQLVEGLQNTYNIEEQKAKNYAQIMFANMDKNRNGSINFSEYITGTIQLSKLVSHSFLQKMFNQIDINKDGYITEEQLNNLILGIDRYEVLGGQKKVNFTSFKKMMIKFVSQQPNSEKKK